MEFITFVIAVAALLIAGIAFQRTGGIEELKRQVDASKFKTDGMRDRTAGERRKVSPPGNQNPARVIGPDPARVIGPVPFPERPFLVLQSLRPSVPI